MARHQLEKEYYNAYTKAYDAANIAKRAREFNPRGDNSITEYASIVTSRAASVAYDAMAAEILN